MSEVIGAIRQLTSPDDGSGSIVQTIGGLQPQEDAAPLSHHAVATRSEEHTSELQSQD